MDADWYIDPLGRYEGRYYDGVRWTHQVSDRGSLANDPDWPPGARKVDHTTPEQGQEAARVDEGMATAETSVSGPSGALAGGAAGSAAALAAGASSSSSPPGQSESFTAEFASSLRSTTETDSVSAQTTVDAAPTIDDVSVTTTSRSATTVAESPARQVAVVSDVGVDTEVTAPAPVTATATTSSDAQTPWIRPPKESGSRKWAYVLGTLALLAGIALLVVPRIWGGDDDAPSTAPEVVQEDSTTEAPAADDGANDESDPGVALPAAESIPLTVGSASIQNGTGVLEDLGQWHRSHVDGRDVELPDNAACFFATEGGTIQLFAYCGPVGTEGDDQLLFDEVPLTLDTSGADVQVEPQTDGVTNDVLARPGLVFVDGNGGELRVSPPASSDGGDVQRGERVPRGQRQPR